MIPVSIDIMKFLEKIKINYENVKDKELEAKRTFYLKNKSEIPFANVFQHKVIKYMSISEYEYVDIFENFLENDTYAMEIYSNSTKYVEVIEEYLKFMYDN